MSKRKRKHTKAKEKENEKAEDVTEAVPSKTEADQLAGTDEPKSEDSDNKGDLSEEALSEDHSDTDSGAPDFQPGSVEPAPRAVIHQDPHIRLQQIIEGALLAAGEPLSEAKLLALFDDDERPERDDFLAAIESIQQHSQDRGFELKQVANGWRFQVRESVAPWVNKMWDEKPQKYSRAMLETLALIAYRQPLTRGDIEEVRGVAVSSHIIKTLTEREWIKVVGHRDVPGRPSLYATTKNFLDYFNLKSLDELPSLGELKDIDSLNASLDFDGITPETESVENKEADGNDAVEDLNNEDTEESSENTDDSQAERVNDSENDDVSEDSALVIDGEADGGADKNEDVVAADDADTATDQEIESEVHD